MNRFIALPLALLLSAALVAGGCNRGEEARDAGEQQAAPEKVVNVQVRRVAAEDLQETFTLPGTLEAWEDLTLAAELTGAVRWTGPEEGARLSAGEEILRIDPETVQANLAQAKAQYQLQKKQYDRVRQLVEQGFASQQELDDAESAFTVAEAALQKSRVALQKSSVRSPVAGVLDRRLVERGEYVNEGTPVATVVQVDRLKVLVDVPEKDVARLKVGQTVQVSPAGIDGQTPAPRPGVIRHIAYKADLATRTYRTKLEVDNQNRQLRPGMIVRGIFVRRTLPDVVAIPLYATLERDGRRVVYVENDGRAQLRTVTPGPVIGDQLVVEAGLKPGARLIVSGQQLLSDGARVQVVQAGQKP